MDLSAAIHRNFRPPFVGTFDSHLLELSAAIRQNFGLHLTELSAAIHRNFQTPFVGTFGIRSLELWDARCLSELSAALCSSELSAAVRRSFRPPCSSRTTDNSIEVHCMPSGEDRIKPLWRSSSTSGDDCEPLWVSLKDLGNHVVSSRINAALKNTNT